jgi:hypothetical protein
MADRKSLSPEQARQLSRKASAELQQCYLDALCHGSQAFRTKNGNIKAVSHVAPKVTTTLAKERQRMCKRRR